MARVKRGVTTHAALAWELLDEGQTATAATETQAVCRGAGKLLARVPKKPDYRRGYQSCLALRATLSLRAGAKGDALQFAGRAVDIARSVRTIDPAEDAHSVARTYWLLGIVQQATGNAAAAQASWASGVAAIPANAPEKADETALHAALLERLGRGAEAAALRRELDRIGYRNPEFRPA